LISIYLAECISCPPGRLCSVAGIYNLTMSLPCSDGMICDESTGKNDMIDCKEGYYCPKSSTLVTQYDYKCPAGFYCPEATGIFILIFHNKKIGDSNKFFNKCPQGFFCPQGTGYYYEFKVISIRLNFNSFIGCCIRR
jgi:hypothetical protein